ncbi:MAG TPA: methionine biosynthesis protein MetW, partial [Novosphingobium sp.]|nr:methionine biosynthesis protein MetW [Novosphingobium sp.]
TVRDFRELVAQKGYRIEGQWFLSGDRETGPAAASWRAEHAVFLLSR